LLVAAEDREAEAVALVGDLSGGDDRPQSYRSVFRALASGERPAYWVPGPADAPVDDYLREAQNMEVVFPFLHGVHGTAAFAPGYVLFAGVGGEIDDDPGGRRDELQRLRYPRWEAEYRLKLLRELAEHELVLLFWTPPAHKGRGTPGSEALAELVNTHRPRLVVCGGERGVEALGRSTVVAPGSLRDGHYAVADLQTREVQLEELAAPA
jgi:Icc-related predicted phosphoesterase